MRPANFALLPEVFPREQLLTVNTAQEVLDAVSNIAGPGLAIALVSTFGLTWAFAADSLSFLLVALTLLALKPLPRTEGEDGAGARDVSNRMPFGDVWRLLHGNPSLMVLLAVNATYSLGVATLVVLYAPLALHGLRAGEWGYGLLVTATGVGALIGAALTPRFRSRLTPSVAHGLLCISGALLVAVGLLDHLWVVTALLGLALIPESAVFLVFSTRSQQEMPRHMVGRYFGTVFAALSILLPAGNFLGGVLASGPGARTGVAVVGFGFVVAASSGWLWTKCFAPAPSPRQRS